jgi:uncharacterized membrane protein
MNQPIFEARLVPHRSLSRRGLGILLGAITLAACGTAAVFLWLGAWPVLGFSGAEIGLAAVLLRLHALGARACETLLLTDSALIIRRADPAGRQTETRLAPAWLQVRVEERPGRVPRLVLRSHGRATEIATMLGEAEKRDLAGALADALAHWRAPIAAD